MRALRALRETKFFKRDCAKKIKEKRLKWHITIMRNKLGLSRRWVTFNIILESIF